MTLACAGLNVPVARADYIEGTDMSTLAATEFEGKPIIAFSAFDGINGVKTDQVVIATSATKQPKITEDWDFHSIRDDLYAYPNDELIEGQLIFTQTGTGLALSFMAFSPQMPRQTIVAWSTSYPYSSADWNISPTGLNFIDEIASAGTDRYLVLGVATMDKVGQAELALGCAAWPLPECSDAWRKTYVTVDIGGKPIIANEYSYFSRLVLSAAGGELYAAASIETVNGLIAVIGSCVDPLTDLSSWHFTTLPVDLGYNSFDFIAIESQLYFAYSIPDSPNTIKVLQCESSAAFENSGWRESSVADWGRKMNFVRGHTPAVQLVYEDFNVHGARGYFAYRAQTNSRDIHIGTWKSSALPGFLGYTCYLDPISCDGSPAVAWFQLGDPGSVMYAWSSKPEPQRKSDWHLCTVYQGQPSGLYSARPVLTERFYDFVNTYRTCLAIVLSAIAIALVVLLCFSYYRRRYNT